ncbi:MAG: hypothetical protein Q9186_004377 [Xanthomendoza sp. 1 TL-2023]
MDFINNAHPDDQTSSVIPPEGSWQLTELPCQSSSSHAFHGARNLHWTEPSEKQCSDRKQILSDYNRSFKSNFRRFMNSSGGIYECITELVDHSFPSSHIGFRFYDLGNELRFSTKAVLAFVSRKRRLAKLQEEVESASFTEIGTSVTRPVKSFQTGRGLLLLREKTNELHISQSWLNRYISLINAFYIRWRLMQDAHVFPVRIAPLYLRPELLLFNERFDLEQKSSSSTFLRTQALHALELTIIKLIVEEVLPVSFAAVTLQLSITWRCIHKWTRLAISPLFAYQGSKDTSECPGNRREKQLPLPNRQAPISHSLSSSNMSSSAVGTEKLLWRARDSKASGTGGEGPPSRKTRILVRTLRQGDNDCSKHHQQYMDITETNNKPEPSENIVFAGSFGQYPTSEQFVNGKPDNVDQRRSSLAKSPSISSKSQPEVDVRLSPTSDQVQGIEEQQDNGPVNLKVAVSEQGRQSIVVIDSKAQHGSNYSARRPPANQKAMATIRKMKGRSRGYYPEYLKYRNLSASAVRSLDDLLWELDEFTQFKCDEGRSYILLALELLRGKQEISHSAHELRWWCCFRERWNEVLQDQYTSKASMSNMLTELHARHRAGFRARFLSSWRAVLHQYYLVQTYQKLYTPSLFNRKYKDTYSSLIVPLIVNCRGISHLLLGVFFDTDNCFYRLMQLAWSMKDITRSCESLGGPSLFSAVLRRRHIHSRASFIALTAEQRWLKERFRDGLSPSNSILLDSSLHQYLTATLCEEQGVEKAYTETHVGSFFKSYEVPHKQEQKIQSPKSRLVESDRDAKISSSSVEQGPRRPWPSSPAFPAFRFPENRAMNITTSQSTTATFHTSSWTTEPSPMPTRSVESHEVLAVQEENPSDDEGTGSRPIRSPLGYHIPCDKIRASMLASRSSRSAYWQYTLYEGPQGQKVKVHYCKSLETTERIARLFLNETVIGFDIEWKPSATSKDGIRKNVALIQFASEERIALFHIARFSKDNTIESLVAPTFKAIMESASITKVGVAVKGDCSRLRNYMDIHSHGLFELSHLYKLVKFSTSDVKKIDKKLYALAKQVEEHLMLPMYKDSSVRGSDWSEDLNYEQIYYAASDSYAGFQLYHVLNNKRLSLSPTPPLPAHAELGLPIRLANGQTVADYKEPAPEEPSPDDEERVTTPLPSTEEIADDVLNLQIEDTNSSPTVEQNRKKEPPKSKPWTSLSSHPSVIAAVEWVAKYRASTSNPSSSSNDATYPTLSSSSSSISPSHSSNTTRTKPRPVSQSSLRAYFLFHHHGLSINDIASLLRDPPLQKTTVAAYILEAARVEGLELDAERIRECEEEVGGAGNRRWKA